MAAHSTNCLSIPGEHRVKFATGTVLDPEHVHVEEAKGDQQLPEAHIGLLRNHHTYSAEIPIKHSLGTKIIAQNPQFNIYVRVSDISPTEELQPTEDGPRYSNVVTVHVKTIKEGSIHEKIELVSEDDPGKTKEVMVTAKVLLTNQGNPMLKNGVHMLSHQHEDESDFTEWPGHGRDAN